MQRVRSPPEFSACLSLWYFTFCERSACVAALVVLHAIKGRTRGVLPSLVDCGSAIEVSLPLLKDVLIPPRASWSRARVLPGGPRHYRWHGSPFVSRRACHNFRLDVHVAVFPIHSVVLVPRRCHVLLCGVLSGSFGFVASCSLVLVSPFSPSSKNSLFFARAWEAV